MLKTLRWFICCTQLNLAMEQPLCKHFYFDDFFKNPAIDQDFQTLYSTNHKRALEAFRCLLVEQKINLAYIGILHKAILFMSNSVLFIKWFELLQSMVTYIFVRFDRYAKYNRANVALIAIN